MTHDPPQLDSDFLPNLAAILSPIDVHAFFSKHWGKEPLFHLRGDMDYYRNFISVIELESFLQTTPLRIGDLRFANYENACDSSPMPFNNDGTLNYARMSDEIKKGATVIFDNINNRFQPVQGLCVALERDLCCPVSANLYLTPAASQGFSPHFDHDDFFVLQLSGQKQWTIYEGKTTLPVLEHRGFPLTSTEFGNRIADVCISQGDLLYVPRGFIHSVKACDCFSMHLTVGVSPPTWADLIIEAVKDVTANDVRLRRNLPHDMLINDSELSESDTQLSELMHAIASSTSLRKVVQRLKKQILTRMNKHRPLISQIEIAASISNDSAFRVDTSVPWKFYVASGTTTLTFPGGELEFRSDLSALLQTIRNLKHFKIEDLPAGLIREQIDIVQRLVSVGIVDVIESR